MSKIEALARELEYDAQKLFLRAPQRFKDEDPAIIKLGIEIIISRQKSAKLGSWATSGFMTQKALEQATRAEVAKYHASYFSGCKKILEIGAGLGSDTSALARAGDVVVTLEPDNILASLTETNLTLQKISNVAVVKQTLEELSITAGEYDGLWSDPDRRPGDGGVKVRDPERYAPPLSSILNLPIAGPRGIKLSPASPSLTVPAEWKLEYLAWEDECIELVLWAGTSHPAKSVFDVSTQNRFVVTEASLPDLVAVEDAKFLVEPHAAILAAHGADDLFGTISFARIDPDCAYGIGVSAPPSSPWYRAFEIIEIMPFNYKRLGNKLAELGWNNRTEFKKRNFPEDPEGVRKKLRLPAPQDSSGKFGVVLMTRLGAKQIAIIARRL